jgi:hypothetical protein
MKEDIPTIIFVDQTGKIVQKKSLREIFPGYNYEISGLWRGNILFQSGNSDLNIVDSKDFKLKQTIKEVSTYVIDESGNLFYCVNNWNQATKCTYLKINN